MDSAFLIIFDGAILVLSLVLLLVSIIKSLHLLQLNGYSNKQTLVWLLVHYGFFGLFSLPGRMAKKPLVWTARTIRLLVLCVLISLVLLLCMCYLIFSGLDLDSLLFVFVFGYPPFFLAVLLFLLLPSPLLVPFANLVISPIERTIRNHYVRDAKRILAAHSNLIVIGITGSYGKTSMKHYLHTLLSGKYNVLMTPESYNTPMGVVKTIREHLSGTHEIFLCEMGARHQGDIAEICDIVQPQIGVITAIAEQHLETFKSLDAIIQTKFELAHALAKGAGHTGSDPKSAASLKLGSDPIVPRLICNGDDVNISSYIRSTEFTALNLPVITYGMNATNNYSAQSIITSMDAPVGSSFSIGVQADTSATKPRTLEIKGLHTCLIGQHNVQNIAGAVAVAMELGVDAEQSRQRVGKIAATPHRLEITNAGAYTLLDDAFNSNPAGAAAALDVLSLLKGYKILITPGMIELGAKEEEENAAFGRSASKVCDLVCLVNTKQSSYIKQGLLEVGYPPEQIAHYASFSDAFAHATQVEQANKIILIENDLTDIY